MDEQVVTLADLLRPWLQAVVVSINPSPVSVAADPFYQGQVRPALLRAPSPRGFASSRGRLEADRALEVDIGFTDIVKRPTPAELVGALSLDL